MSKETTITLANGKTVELSEESYRKLEEASQEEYYDFRFFESFDYVWPANEYAENAGIPEKHGLVLDGCCYEWKLIPCGITSGTKLLIGVKK